MKALLQDSCAFLYLRGLLEPEEAAIGVFITLEPATPAMRKEAAEAGFFQTKSVSATKHPRLQILSIEDLLNGQKNRHARRPGHPLLQTSPQSPR